MYKDLIKQDLNGKYYLVDSDRFIFYLDGVSRLEAYQFLVDIRCVKEENALDRGINNFIPSINRILDGVNQIGRFKFYRVSDKTDSLEKQMKNEQKQVYGGKK